MPLTSTQFPMPPMPIRIMQEDDTRLLQTGADLARLLYEFGLTSESSLLDVGSCYARVPLGLLSATDYRGSYLGFDVLRKQVSWCQDVLTPAAPNFSFEHIDVRNDRYNPAGTVDPLQLRFPTGIASVDFICLFSIFTHFYRADIEHYLAEFRRVLKPGGTAVTTWFLYDAARSPLITGEDSAYRMTYELDASTRYNDSEDPLRAIAFDEALVRSMVAAAGLEVAAIHRGTWCGEPGKIFQDLVILRRPGRPIDHVRAQLGRVRRGSAGRLRRARKRARRVYRDARRRFAAR